MQTNLPASILGGDPFNQFRFLYRRSLWWRLNDPEYCYSVMWAAYEAGGRAFDLSFAENTRLFQRLLCETGESLLGFGNPTWEQGVKLNGRFLQYERDRILHTLVEQFWPRPIARLVDDTLSMQAEMLFGYDRSARLLSDEEISEINIDVDQFRTRLGIFKDCQYIFFGGSDADWLVSLGRIDLLHELAKLVRAEGYQPILLCHYATLVLPAAQQAGIDCFAYAIPLNKTWTWFDHEECVDIVRALEKPVIAFMPLASGDLRKDVRGSLDWLFSGMGVASILFGTATPGHAAETTRVAIAAKQAAIQQKIW